MSENVVLSQEELQTAEKFHKLLDTNIRCYIPWYIFDDSSQTVSGNEKVDDALFHQVTEYAESITAAASQVSGYYGVSILHQLVTHNYYEAAKFLLEKGVSPNLPGTAGKGDYTECYKGVTPLHIACAEGNYPMVKLLLEHGADASVSDDKHRNCFHYLTGTSLGIWNFSRESEKKAAEQRVLIAECIAGSCDINQKDADGLVPLLYLVMKKNSNYSHFLIKPFLSFGADPFAEDKDGNTALIYAAERKHFYAIAELAKIPELVNRRNVAGDTALHKAMATVYDCRGLSIYMLIKAGADCRIKNAAGQSPAEFLEENKEDLYELTYTEKYVLGEKLSLEDYYEWISYVEQDWYGKELDDRNTAVYGLMREYFHAIDRDDDTELADLLELLERMVLDKESCGEAIQALLDEGYEMDMTICDGSEHTTLRDICVKKAWQNNRIMPALKQLGVNLDEAWAGGCTPAYLIVKSAAGINPGLESRWDDVIDILGYCSPESMTELNIDGEAAIHLAATIQQKRLMEYMIERGVNMNATTDAPSNIAGNTALHIACYYSNAGAACALLKAGADDTLVNSMGETAAHRLFARKDAWARRYNEEDTLKILAMLKTVDKHKDGTGETPLLLMLKHDIANKRLLEQMLDQGADINAADHNGCTPLLACAERGSQDLLKILMKAGADLTARDRNGNGVLHFVLNNANCELARLLIKKGADYNIVNAKKESPVSIAIKKGYDAVLELMSDIQVPIDTHDEDNDYEDDYEDGEDDE